MIRNLIYLFLVVSCIDSKPRRYETKMEYVIVDSSWKGKKESTLDINDKYWIQTIHGKSPSDRLYSKGDSVVFEYRICID